MSVPSYPGSQHDSPHGRIYDRHMSHPAWIGLTPVAFKVIAYLLAKYRPGLPNIFEAGGARLGQAVGVSEKTARAAVDELIEKGHLTEERKGRTIGQRNSRERMVSLTRYDTETRKGAPDWPIEVWRRNMSNPA